MPFFDLFSLPITLTHFTLSSYEQALRFPNYFSISGLARLGVKPRLFRFSWVLLRPLSHSCFFLLALPLFLGACPLSLWSPPFPFHALTLIPPSCQVLAFAHLDILPLTICCSGLTALFLFHLAKAALAYLPTALLVALRPLSFSACLSFSELAPFCKLFDSLSSTNKSATSLLQCDSCSVLSSIFPFTSISLAGLNLKHTSIFCYL